MNSDTLLAFLGTATILTMAPGLDTAMVLRTAAAEGPRHGAAAAFGIGLGCLCWGSAAAFGVGTLFAALPMLFLALKWAGAAYLGWLGVNLLLAPRRAFSAAGAVARGAPTLGQAAGRGFMTNILNPKVGLFYLTLLPQFVPAGDDASGSALTLALTHVAIATSWFILLAVATGLIRPALQRPQVMTGLDRVTGMVLILLGFHVSLASGVLA
ncbi:threonine/homoserine/homoserine lactone efflux protein [Sphingomonas zeicaulis]|uniref:LysE family translocator n=1 Tax=Sphingomonas zeicaulis TaxID=1632740 RepID=UPI003D1CCF53